MRQPQSRPLDYDRLAAAYARNRRAHPAVLARLLDAARAIGRARLLEIGCGTGNYLTLLAEATACEPCGLDPSREMLDRADSRGARLDLVVGRGETLPFAAGSFDLIYTVDVIHHIRDVDAHFREAYRALGPGGRVCTVTDSAADIARRSPLSRFFPETVAVELRRYPRIETLRASLAAAGFDRIEEDHVSFDYALDDIQPYRDRAFSSLHLISQEAFAAGLDRLTRELAKGPIAAVSPYTLLWAKKPR